MKLTTVIVGYVITLSLLFAIEPDINLQNKTENWIRRNPHSWPHWMTPEEELRKDEIGRDFYVTPPPAGPVRNIAEFEPMEGVLIRYPIGISYSFIAEMSEDVIVTTIVTGQSQENVVRSYYQANGVNLDNCNFLYAPSDSYWTRDYGPWYVVDGNNEVGIINFIYNRPRPNDNDIPIRVAESLGVELYGMNLITAGGNYMTDGMGISASSQLVWEENPSQSHLEIAQLVEDYLGVTTYHVIPDPNNTYIDHIDCWGKFLDIDKVLIRSVPISHPQYDEIEATADYFANQISSYGTPYEVYRVFTPQDQPYTNSMILNDKVFVPIMGSIWDSDALTVYEEAMPGYEVIGITGSWEPTDGLHCRAKGIADRGMLYIQHIPISGEINGGSNDYEISATIIPYSGEPLSDDSLRVYYRINGSDYQFDTMTSTGNNEYIGVIPALPYSGEVAYYIHAADASGRSANHPFIGAPDPHVFNVVSSSMEFDMTYFSSWNLVGLPLIVENENYLSLLPAATENTFYSFGENGYVQETSFLAGTGYWLHFGESGVNTINGVPFNAVTISLNEGWNLLSGISSSVNSNNIIDPDEIIINNTLFEFHEVLGYVNASSVEPGKGYWIRSSAAGEITIASDVASKRSEFINRMENANKISFNGNTLYFGIAVPEDEKLSYSLPPKPPGAWHGKDLQSDENRIWGNFDVRFTGDWKFTQDFGEIEVLNNREVLTISYNVRIGETWCLKNLKTGEEYTLESRGNMVISGSPEKLILSKQNPLFIPDTYELLHNYPNPFNPVTTVRFDLPVRTQVSIIIFDMLGQEIERLVNDQLPTGRHRIDWNASEYGSGIYFVKMITPDFTATNKIMLVK